ncbi:UNVERIFIED_CONTAM: hypothetical protein HDU68_000951 [Siphonaria sp. JEL0065]|nr:hypothetical protein HDU68_000951 [Siphonaria sp. JEL0065]
MISMTNDMADQQPESSTDRISTLRFTCVQTIRTSHATLEATATSIGVLCNDELKAKGSPGKKNYKTDQKRRKQWGQAVLDVDNAVAILGETLVQCDSLDIEDAFNTFFELKTHLLILRLIPIDSTNVPEHTIHLLTASLLKFFNLLSENVHNEYILFLLFSNNYINDVISFRGYGFRRKEDLENDTLNYFITLLKNLSNKLNSNSINFFLNGNLEDFPLFVESLALFESPERMVRIAARTVTLNVFKVNDDAVGEFLVNSVHAFDRLSVLWEKDLDMLVDQVSKSNDVGMLPKFETDVDDCVDSLLYFEEVFALNIPLVGSNLLSSLMNGVLFKLAKNISSENVTSKAVSLFFLTQVFIVISHTPLLDALVDLLLSPDHTNRASIFTGLQVDIWDLISPESSSLLVPCDTTVSLSLALIASILNCPHISRETLITCNMCPRQKLKTRHLMESLVSLSPPKESTAFLHESVNDVSSDVGYNVEFVGLLIEILGSIHAAKLRPISLDLVVWILEKLLQTGKDSVSVLNEEQSKFHEKWRSMILALVNDGVDLVVELLEYETCQSKCDIPKILTDTRLLLPRPVSGSMRHSNTLAKELEYGFVKEVRDLAFLVRIWELASQCLVKLGYSDKYNLPLLVGVGSVSLGNDAVVEFGSDSQKCILYQGKNSPVNGILSLSSTSDSLQIADSGNGTTLFSKPFRQTTCILSQTDSSVLEFQHQAFAFADKSRRMDCVFSGVEGYDLVWQDEKMCSQGKIVFRASAAGVDDGVCERVFAFVEKRKCDVLEARRIAWLTSI